MPFQDIQTYARFQWINHSRVIHLLEQALPYAGTGRRGHDKVLLLRWLMYKQVMGCTYRDLESMSGIDYSTFIKFRQRLQQQGWCEQLQALLSQVVADSRQRLETIVDSSFVETYSHHRERGSSFCGYRRKEGFKLHQILERRTRLPLLHAVSRGSEHDVVLGKRLYAMLPATWPVRTALADKGYDANELVELIYHKWAGVRVGIPIRHTNQRGRGASRVETAKNYRAKAAHRDLDPRLFKKRTEIERYFSRKKCVFKLGHERTRHLNNFATNCALTAVMEYLEFLAQPGRGSYSPSSVSHY